MKFIENEPVVLASASPRRKELLEGLGVHFTIEPAQSEEPAVSGFTSPISYVEACAYQKAEEVAGQHPEAVVIGADTVVVLEGEVLLKPKNKEEAVQSLRKLSGKTHDVITAVSVLRGDSDLSFHERTEVTFFELPEPWIEAYTETPDPYDKAGAYGIQTASGLFVKEIRGDYNTVVGLPVAKLAHSLAAAGWIRLEGGIRNAH